MIALNSDLFEKLFVYSCVAKVVQETQDLKETNREGGTDFGHGDSDEPSEEGDDDPTPYETGGARVLEA